MALVSTIIPAFNAANFVAQAIDSALRQNVSQQIIVVDDGSSDGTADVVQAYGNAVDLVRQPNGGVSAARNRGISVAEGDFLAFLDADDVWLPGKLARQLDLFASDPALGTVICDEIHVTAEGDIVRPSFLATRRCHKELPIRPSRLHKPVTWLVRESFFPTSGVLTRREVLNRAGRFDTTLSICEDRDLWFRLAFQAPVGLVPEVMLRYLTGRPNSLSAMSTQIRWAEALYAVLKRYRSQIDSHVRMEKGHPHAVLGEVFGELGDVFWYGDCRQSAASAYGDALRCGELRHLAKWAATRSGTVSLMRRVKQEFGL